MMKMIETTDLNDPALGGLDAEAQVAFEALMAVLDSFELPAERR